MNASHFAILGVMSKRRVVITGMGLICSLGQDKEEFFNNLINSKSGISKMDFFPDVKTLKDICRVSSVCHEFAPEEFLDPKIIRRTDRFIQFALSASIIAVKDANLDLTNYSNPEKVGAVVGSAAGGVLTLIEQHNILQTKGPGKVSPFTIPSMISNMPAGYVSIYHNAKGPATCTVTACATGTSCIGDAFRLIQSGSTDVMFAGGCEAPLTNVSIAAFGAARTLSTKHNDDPEKSS